MPRVYLDTNIYIRGILKSSSSSIILENAKRGLLTVIISDYLLDEVSSWFKVNVSKDASGYIRNYILGLPSQVFIPGSEWRKFIPEYTSFIEDKEDLPHICAYLASNSEYFITKNRRLTKMKIKEKVNFKSPKEFVEEVLD